VPPTPHQLFHQTMRITQQAAYQVQCNVCSESACYACVLSRALSASHATLPTTAVSSHPHHTSYIT
jgi:hypothetical protein